MGGVDFWQSGFSWLCILAEAFQAYDEGSIPFARSTLFYIDNFLFERHISAAEFGFGKHRVSARRRKFLNAGATTGTDRVRVAGSP